MWLCGRLGRLNSNVSEPTPVRDVQTIYLLQRKKVSSSTRALYIAS